MHTWARKGIALAVSGVLTVGMAASLPFGSLADAADEDIIFQAEGEDLDGALGRIFMGSNFRGIPAAVSAT